jgi:hypothetical protein
MTGLTPEEIGITFGAGVTGGKVGGTAMGGNGPIVVVGAYNDGFKNYPVFWL